MGFEATAINVKPATVENYLFQIYGKSNSPYARENFIFNIQNYQGSL